MKKEHIDEVISPSSGTRTELTLDSIFLYARQIYLWNDALPTYTDFNPRQRYGDITSDITTFKKELLDISQFKIDPHSGAPYEFPVYVGNPKYSYLNYGKTNAGSVADISSPSATSTIIRNSVIMSNGLAIAYVALSHFPALNDNNKVALENVFNELASSAPRFIVIDLRHNSGGYVETAEYLANLIAPSSLNKKIMYSEQFNTRMQEGQASILKYQPYLNEDGKQVTYKGRKATMADVDYTENGNTYRFNKKGKLESIEHIYFIVSEQTASASEMLISCLKPYFKIQLVGKKTYGKPVGFFGINIDQYSIFLSSFLIKNANGWSDYFQGMEPDIYVKGENTIELGSVDELCLKAVLSHIKDNYTAIPTKMAVTKEVSLNFIELPKSKSRNQLPEMLEHRLRLPL